MVGERALIVAPDREGLPEGSPYSVRNLRQSLHLGKSNSLVLRHLNRRHRCFAVDTFLLVRGAPSGPAPELTRLAVSAPRTHIF